MALPLPLLSVLLMLWIGWQDMRRQRISNLALLALLACALLYLYRHGQLLGGAAAELTDILLALLLVAALTLPGMALGQLGAGDVKLLWVLCWVFSLPQLLLVMVAGFLLLACSSRWLVQRPLPLAPYLTLAGLLVWLGGSYGR
ncbi:prepilin peptidase [Pokkaliibacter sp. MBI-7]|uniref:prepilin peptidase n=1 Tax=Pokkaliibacter sp. MBI-7 TaxID=3040600 RepID=UPI002449424B|nr:prepilin peptidase [Pokkaliibacter sp. MBI-7]MDH2433048.1 prepilin peptidase [Pokkaliibacter sp. MBI-7]